MFLALCFVGEHLSHSFCPQESHWPFGPQRTGSPGEAGWAISSKRKPIGHLQRLAWLFMAGNPQKMNIAEMEGEIDVCPGEHLVPSSPSNSITVGQAWRPWRKGVLSLPCRATCSVPAETLGKKPAGKEGVPAMWCTLCLLHFSWVNILFLMQSPEEIYYLKKQTRYFSQAFYCSQKMNVPVKASDEKTCFFLFRELSEYEHVGCGRGP